MRLEMQAMHRIGCYLEMLFHRVLRAVLEGGLGFRVWGLGFREAPTAEKEDGQHWSSSFA